MPEMWLSAEGWGHKSLHLILYFLFLIALEYCTCMGFSHLLVTTVSTVLYALHQGYTDPAKNRKMAENKKAQGNPTNKIIIQHRKVVLVFGCGDTSELRGAGLSR